jgi:DNA invertase Pin-like site-specific DNA recombinase
MKNIGYVRVSTVDQNTERQLAGIELDKVFTDKRSARDTKREALNQMLEFIREGDTVYVHDISRLARNISDLHRLVEEITNKGCTLKFMKEGLTFTNKKQDATSQLLLGMLGAVYGFERAILLERQREGIEIAKRAGKYTGRAKTINDKVIRQVLATGLSMRKAAAKLGVSLSSVQRAKQGSSHQG